jgi:hypothetical protein
MPIGERARQGLLMAEHGRAAVARQRRTNSGWWCTGALLLGVNLAAGVLIRTVAQGRRPDDLQPNELRVIAASGVVFLGAVAWWWGENRRLRRRSQLGVVAHVESPPAPAAPARALGHPAKRPVELVVQRPVERPVPATVERPSAQLQALRGVSATMERRMTDAGYPTQRELAGVPDENIEDLAEELNTFPYRLEAWVAEARANTAPDSPFMRSA